MLVLPPLNWKNPVSVYIYTVCIFYTGVGGGTEAVLMAEVTRSVDDKKKTGIISILVAIRQTGLLIGTCVLHLLINDILCFSVLLYLKVNAPQGPQC